MQPSTQPKSNRGPGYAKHPEHRVETHREPGHVVIVFAGEVIAETDDAIRLEETGHRPVHYVPRKDVKMQHLVRTDHHSYCPFKGQASYFSLSSGRTADNAVWSYETPYDEVSVIEDRLAFYPDKVDSISVTPRS